MSTYPKGEELTSRVFEVMKDKANLTSGKLIGLGFLAGIYIGFGGLLCALVLSYAGESFNGLVQIAAGAVFTLGLAAVLLAGAELFTGNTLMLGAVMTADLPLSKAMRVLPIAYVSNLIGSLVLVALAVGAGVHQLGEGALGTAMHSLAEGKVAKDFWTIFFSGIGANFLVCLGVWMAIAGETVTQKFAALFLPVTAFVALGLEHSIANMSILPYAYVISGTNGLAVLSLFDIGANLLASTLGNIVGGASLALIYGLSYRDKLS